MDNDKSEDGAAQGFDLMWSPEAIAAFRRQRAEGNRLAREEIAKRGFRFHPKVSAVRDREPS